MRFRTIGLTGLIMGLGRVNLLSGQIQHYRVNLLGHGAGRLGRAGHARVVMPAQLRRIRPEADFQLRNYFSFSNMFCKLQIKFEFQ
jgi:hypothetical protein